MVTHRSRQGPLLEPDTSRSTKDPCVVHDGTAWHLYGSSHQLTPAGWGVLHARALQIDGPWHEQGIVRLDIDGGCVAAPGVIHDAEERMFHMFVQTDCFRLNGTVEHLSSVDGHHFTPHGPVLRSIPGTGEAGIYDPHPALIDGEKYLVYSGMDRVARADLYLAWSPTGSWFGPWERVGTILTHAEVAHHNQHDHHNYEWGLEGAQLIQLPDGSILLIAVCFLPEGVRGTRQRVFFAVADEVRGPYKSLGPALQPDDPGWGEGENGHATGLLVDDALELFYQARCPSTPWRYGRATFDLTQLRLLKP